VIGSAVQTPNRVLVTGASGFIGSRLCLRLLEAGAEVHGVSRVLQGRPGLHWWNADVGDEKAVTSVARDVRPHVVVHLAGHVTGSRSIDAVVPTMRTNFLGALNVLLAAADAGCRRVVLAGSLEEPSLDQDEGIAASPYAAAKFAATAYGRMFHLLYELPVVMLRLFMVYGPGQQDDAKLVPYVIRSLLRGEAPQLSSGERPVDWVFVDDVVAGLCRGIDVPGIEGETLDIGSGVLTPVRAVVEEIRRQLQTPIDPRFDALPDRPYERVRAADTARTQDRLGWSASTTLEHGLANTIEWYAAMERGT
jgi:UDP-glucose 4-epimerase